MCLFGEFENPHARFVIVNICFIMSADLVPAFLDFYFPSLSPSAPIILGDFSSEFIFIGFIQQFLEMFYPAIEAFNRFIVVSLFVFLAGFEGFQYIVNNGFVNLDTFENITKKVA